MHALPPLSVLLLTAFLSRIILRAVTSIRRLAGTRRGMQTYRLPGRTANASWKAAVLLHTDTSINMFIYIHTHIYVYCWQHLAASKQVRISAASSSFAGLCTSSACSFVFERLAPNSNLNWSPHVERYRLQPADRLRLCGVGFSDVTGSSLRHSVTSIHGAFQESGALI